MKSGIGRAPRICRRDIRLKKGYGIDTECLEQKRRLEMVLVKELGIRKL